MLLQIYYLRETSPPFEIVHERPRRVSKDLHTIVINNVQDFGEVVLRIKSWINYYSNQSVFST